MRHIVIKSCARPTLLASCLLMACGDNAKLNNGLVIGEFALSVPARYRVADGMPAGSRSPEKLDQSDDALLVIPIQDTGISSDPNSSGRRLQLYVYLVSDGGDSFIPRDAADAWLMTGDFSSRIIEAEPDQAFFRIYSEHAYPAVWYVFRGVPDDLESPVEIEERWVADCMGTPGTQQTPLQDANCLTYFRWNSLLVQISFPGSLIPRSDELKARIGTMIDSWYADEDTSSQSQP